MSEENDLSPSNDVAMNDMKKEEVNDDNDNKLNSIDENKIIIEPKDLPSTDNISKNNNTKKEEKKPINLISFNEETQCLHPGFEDVKDELLSFNSESDFAIFNKQISSDIPLQRLVAVKRMMKSCNSWGIRAVLSILDRMKKLSQDKEMVIRQAIAEVLGPFAEYLVSYQKNNTKIDDIDIYEDIIIKELLPLIKNMLTDAMEVRQGAGQSLITIASILEKQQVYEHVLKIVLHMAHDESDDQKITALPLLGDLAPIVGSAVCKNYLSADLHALSQDNSFRVRKACVQYFGPICEQLGNTDAEKTLLPIFKQLCQDSIWSVRKGCVESFVDVSKSINQDTRLELIPLCEKFLNDSSRWVRNTAYEILGPFISTLREDQIKSEFLKYYTNIPHLSSAEADADCTNHCAFNFPAVAQTLGKNRWIELNDTYKILVRKTFKSRKTLACSIHELCKTLGKELTEKYLLNAIEFFLKDIDDIREGIIKNLWKIFKFGFNIKIRKEYLTILWDLAGESDVNWRFRLLLANQLNKIIYLYPKEVVLKQIVPLTFQLCQDRMADVRHEACLPVCDLINFFTNNFDITNYKIDIENNEETKTNNEDYLNEIITKCNNIYKSNTYSKRLLYIRIADCCFNKIKKEYFDKIFLDNILNYSKDNIINVRYCCARFIKNNLYNNNEYNKLDKVKNAIKILQSDKDDVEIIRFFASDNEIEMFLQLKEKEQNQIIATKPKNNVNNNNNMDNDDDDDDDSSDSSLYSSDSDENKNINKKKKNDILNLNLNESTLSSDEQKALKNLDNILDIDKEQEKQDSNIKNGTTNKLIHSPTPFSLNIDENQQKENNNVDEETLNNDIINNDDKLNNDDIMKDVSNPNDTE